MGFASRGITSAEILAAIIDDSTRFSGGDIASILADTITLKGKKHGMIDVWGSIQATITIPIALTDIDLSGLLIPNIPGVTIHSAYALMHIAWIKDSSSGDNQVNVSSSIEVNKSAAGWVTAIEPPNNCLEVLADSRDPCGITFMGDTSLDIISRVEAGVGTDFRWYQVRATATGVQCGGIQMGVRLIF